jgi:hypothetical protein
MGNVGYLVVSETEVVLLRVKQGAFKVKVTDEVLARVPRAHVTDVRFDAAALTLSHLTIQHGDGTLWEFEIPRAYRKRAEAAAQALTRTDGPTASMVR